jgi:hypothetical protein
MRDLQFWLERYVQVDYDIWQKTIKARTLQTMMGGLDWLDQFKLKKQWGHALNRDYTGIKIGKRRRRWLRNRLILITKIAKLRSAKTRLETTKLPFYETKILALGGKVPRKYGI